jgi:hypothetical protein
MLKAFPKSHVMLYGSLAGFSRVSYVTRTTAALYNVCLERAKLQLTSDVLLQPDSSPASEEATSVIRPVDRPAARKYIFGQ